MYAGKPILIHGNPIAGGRLPALCVPLVGRSRAKVLAELEMVVAKQPDLLEWRVDFFQGIHDGAEVLALAAEIRQRAQGIPILFTRRSTKEGGEPLAIGEEAVVALITAVCASRTVDCVDFEMNNDPEHIAQVRSAARTNGVGLVLSFHNFQSTPSQSELCQRFNQAHSLGADVAKVAVMPQRLEDVLAVLGATLEASQELDIPVVSMAMGGYGSMTRLFGGAFGSALSFAVGAGVSAPGQVPIEDMRTVLEILRRSIAAQT
jgi:3-dehydroquinate dehydratase-1